MEQNKIRAYIFYAIGEIFLVVIGILIALQVNNWNQQRVSNERFNFGLKELSSEIQATIFQSSSLTDKLNFQITRMDSVLNYADEIPVARLPGMIQLFDQLGFSQENEVEWKTSYLEFDPNDEKKNNMAKALRFVLSGYETPLKVLKKYDLEESMSKYLMRWDIPIQIYYVGTGYETFVSNSSKGFYTASQLKRVKQLVKDESFIADLQTIKTLKEEWISSAKIFNSGANTFLDYVRDYNPDIELSLKRMEVIGNGLPNGQWVTGIPMKMITEDGIEWEIEQEFIGGEIKFRGDSEWILDWGAGEEDANRLVFKGGNIPVEPGYFRVRINIMEGNYTFTPIEKDN